MKIGFLMLSLVLITHTSIAATSYEDNYNSAMIHYAKNEFTQAIEVFKNNKDDARSVFMIGVMYEKGQGVAQNYPEAANWYMKAAEKDVAAAMYKLGKFYEKGYGVEENRAEAVNWYRKAAAKKDHNATRALKELGEPVEDKATKQKSKKK